MPRKHSRARGCDWGLLVPRTFLLQGHLGRRCVSVADLPTQPLPGSPPTSGKNQPAFHPVAPLPQMTAFYTVLCFILLINILSVSYHVYIISFSF